MPYPLPFPVYQPAMRLITAITQAHVASVTTSPNHQFVTGTIVRLYVYPVNGMEQINQQTGPITVTSPNTFTIPIDTTSYDAFVVPMNPTANNTESCVVPIGELNPQLNAAVQNVLPYP